VQKLSKVKNAFEIIRILRWQISVWK